MPITLHDVLRTYLDDQPYRDSRKQVESRRDTSLTTIRPIVERFIGGQSDIETFRREITHALLSLDTWGATGTGWLMEINKLAKLRDLLPTEAGLRRILTGLRADNLGERIEAFRAFAEEQKKSGKAQGISGTSTVSPGNSAFIISLFAFWLDRDQRPPIYYVSIRRGLRLLLNAGLLPTTQGIRLGNDAIEINTAADHQAVTQVLEAIAALEPRIADSSYWKEAFFLWVIENPDALYSPTTSDDDVIVATTIDHAPLAATSETLLRRLIADLQTTLLVEEELVRRIYHALLAGHVILSGPPGTGKTELARRIPELLWQSEVNAGSNPDPLGQAMATQRTMVTAYTTHLVTATDEWSVRTLIGGLIPSSNGGQPVYRIQYGHLTKAIFENWAINEENPAGWSAPQRKSVNGFSALRNEQEQMFRGRWLIIDEFNRAPIDLALGEALTALGGSGRLRIPIDGGSAELPLPKDFRIIGTLNSFDRNYLNQISEALKRRFAFIEIPPPTRQRRTIEQRIVLAKALSDIAHLSATIKVNADQTVEWSNVVTLSPTPNGGFAIAWATPEPPIASIFGFVWNVFEIIRIYRQLGTAQAISLMRQLLITGVVQFFGTVEQWVSAADLALCDTVADQLQVLLPDELEVLLYALTVPDSTTFTAQLNAVLMRLMSSPRRLAAQIGALNAVVDELGMPIVILNEDIEQYSDQQPPKISEAAAIALFHWQNSGYKLPQFTRRLRTFKLERGL